MTGGTSGGGISDAVLAIDNPYGRPVQLSSNLTFSANATDIDMKQIGTNPSGTPSYIKGTIFDHTVALKEAVHGVNGYGAVSIKLDNQTGTNDLVIGGSTLAEACYFYGGQNSVRSNNANLTLQRCLFSGTGQTEIDFQGNNATTFRSLSVISCSFMTGKRHILAQHRTNLTVQSNSFNYAAEHSIEWSDNHDGHLLVGDITDPNKGNLFQFNNWACVTAWDNETNYSGGNASFSNQSVGAYTTIVIANNEMNCPPYAGGILIGEWALGSQVSYHQLHIFANEIHSTVKGIQMYNIRGWGGNTNISSTAPDQIVNDNVIFTTVAQVADPFAILIANSPGFAIHENSITSDNSGSSLNHGVIAKFSDHSHIWGNIIAAGIGIRYNKDMLGSDIFCNWLVLYASGIIIDESYLRSGIFDYHGNNMYEYKNIVPYTAIPWNDDILVLNSDNNKNQWVWNNGATNLTITYIGATGSPSIIAPITAMYGCPGPIAGYALPGTNTDINFGSDAGAQWRADYTYEILRLNNGGGDSTVASANIKTIINIENLIGNQGYSEAATALSSLTPSGNYEENYKTVLDIFVDLSYPTKREPTEAEIDSLTAIAEQSFTTGGPAVVLARGYLVYKLNMTFAEERRLNEEAYGTAVIASPCSLSPTSDTWIGLMDTDGNDLDIPPAYVEEDGSFSFDPTALAYYSNLNPSAEYRAYSKYGSRFTVTNKTFQSLDQWISNSPNELYLSSVKVDLDTMTTDEYVAINHETMLTDGEGNIYRVGVSTGTATPDFLIEKLDGSYNPIWSRTYDGPASGDDTATCIFIDEYNKVYVAGKVSNGRGNDFQVLKYDTDGDLLWSSTVADPEQFDNTPTGIEVDPSEGLVSITGTRFDGSETTYRFLSYWQCLPGGERIGQDTEERVAQEGANIEFYPNPTDGKITITLAGQAGVLELFNLEGQLVFSQQITRSGEVVFPVSSTPNGVYLLKFTGTDVVQHSKIVIQRNK